MTKEQEELIGAYMGYVLYPEVRTPTWFYECENYKWEELDVDPVWVKGATEKFKEIPCISRMYWEYEKDIEEKQWEEWCWGFHCDKDIKELWSVLQKLLPELNQLYAQEEKWTIQLAAIEVALLELDIERVFTAVVEAITALNEIKDADNRTTGASTQ